MRSEAAARVDGGEEGVEVGAHDHARVPSRAKQRAPSERGHDLLVGGVLRQVPNRAVALAQRQVDVGAGVGVGNGKDVDGVQRVG